MACQTDKGELASLLWRGISVKSGDQLSQPLTPLPTLAPSGKCKWYLINVLINFYRVNVSILDPSRGWESTTDSQIKEIGTSWGEFSKQRESGQRNGGKCPKMIKGKGIKVWFQILFVQRDTFLYFLYRKWMWFRNGNYISVWPEIGNDRRLNEKKVKINIIFVRKAIGRMYNVIFKACSKPIELIDIEDSRRLSTAKVM